MPGGGKRWLVSALAWALLFPGVLGAQEAARTASPLLPAEHWAGHALRRAEALGLLRGYLPAQQAVPRSYARTMLAEASARAAVEAPHLSALTHGWVAQFAAEFPVEPLGLGERSVTGLGQRVGIDISGSAGEEMPGEGVFPWSRTGAAELRDRVDVSVGASLALGLGRHLSVLAEPALGADEGLALRGWDLALDWRGLRAAVGNQPVRYGYAASGGLVLSGREPLPRLEVSSVAPFHLPSVGRHLGAVSVHAFGSRLAEPRHPGDPYLWGAAASLQPHPRLTLSLHRASIFGGDSVATPVTPRTLFRTLIGHNLLEFENEVVAGQIRVRLPTEAVLPLTVYTEWGAEDAAGAWRDVPGRLYGLLVPALPWLPGVALGTEYVSFAGSCCGNPPWYRHAQHRGGWVNAARPLGHELGGEGRQLTLYSHADLLASRLRLDARLFARTRLDENLYVPGREGRSNGAQAHAALRVAERADLGVSIFHEAGAGWRESAASVGFHRSF